MKLVYVFPSLMIAFSIGAAAVYGIKHDVRRTIYWSAAAVLTAAVTF